MNPFQEESQDDFGHPKGKRIEGFSSTLHDDVHDAASVRQPSPIGAYHAARHHKERRVGRSTFSFSPDRTVQAPSPFFFGSFVPSRGSISDEPVKAEDRVSGCFGISMGGGDGGRGNKPARIPLEREDDPAALIAKTMNHLSLKEREQAYEDVHGVSAAVHETPELIARTLNEMERCLLGIRHKPAYDMATTIRADYVQDAKFRLMFLRADRFEVEKTVKRMLKFLDWKHRLFGPEKLCQWHIGLDELEDDARFMVESGVFQVLPARDSRGRAVFAASEYHHLLLHRSARSALQMLYYMYQCVAEDETNQKAGLVVVAYCLAPEVLVVESEKRNSVWESTQLVLCMPIRAEATHFCTAQHGVQFSLALAAKGFGLFNQARLRVHFGAHVECLYALMSFGVPSALFPITSECELKTGNHKKWFQRRIVKEQELLRGRVFTGIELPGHNDILSGQGKPFQNHSGNQRLRDICFLYLEEYNQTHRYHRNIVARKIVQEILHPSSLEGSIVRFLKRREDKSKSGWWKEETNEEVGFEKVCNALRSIRKQERNAG